MNTDRDRFLEEAMSLFKSSDNSKIRSRDFSTWTGFGELKEWAETKEWWEDFLKYYEIVTHGMRGIQLHYNKIKPDPFANAVYEFLKCKAYRKKEELLKDYIQATNSYGD